MDSRAQLARKRDTSTEKRAKEPYPGLDVLKSIVPAQVSRDQLLDFMELDDWKGDPKYLRRWLDEGRHPDPRSAWYIGESCRRAGVRGASGLAGLCWFDHAGHIAGILANSDEDVVREFIPALIAMLSTVSLISYTSPYDVLRSDHGILTGGADDWLLRQMADTLAFGKISPTLDFTLEAEMLNERSTARAIWSMPDGLQQCIADGAKAWFSIVTSKRADSAAVGLPAPLGMAHIICTTKSTRQNQEVREFALVNLISVWLWRLFALAPEDELRFYNVASTSPTSVEAKTAKLLLYSHARIAEAVNNVTFGDHEIDYHKFIGSYVGMQVARTFGITDDLLRRAAAEESRDES